MKQRRGLIAAAAAGLTGFAAHSDAALILDLRVNPVQGDPNVIVANDKHVYADGVGTVISLSVYARVSGTDGINNETLTLAGASVSSGIGGTLGNLVHATVAPFNGSGSSNGTIQDFDSDGDLDVGSTGTGAAGKIAYRSPSPTAVTNAIDANTAEVLLGTVVFTMTNPSGSTILQVVPRGGTTTGVALWNEDGVATSKSPGTGTFGAAPVVLVDVPEPAGIGLFGIASLGLLARRRSDAAES